MAGWKQNYIERLMSSSKAIAKIRSGSRIYLGSGCAEPQHLLLELVEQGGNMDRLHDVEIVHIMNVGCARHAEQIGADGIISLPPYQKRPSVEEAAEFFKTLAKTVSLPIFIQNSDGQYGPALSVDTMVSLAREYPNISYVKEEAKPVLERMTELAQKGKDLIHGVYSGAGGTNLLNELDNGSRGSCPAVGLIDVFAEVFNLYDSGNKEKAEKLFAGLKPMFTFSGKGMHWIVKQKEILRRRGIFNNTKSRIAPDFKWSSEDAKAAFDEAYDAVRPLFSMPG